MADGAPPRRPGSRDEPLSSEARRRTLASVLQPDPGAPTPDRDPGADLEASSAPRVTVRPIGAVGSAPPPGARETGARDGGGRPAPPRRPTPTLGQALADQTRDEALPPSAEGTAAERAAVERPLQALRFMLAAAQDMRAAAEDARQPARPTPTGRPATAPSLPPLSPAAAPASPPPSVPPASTAPAAPGAVEARPTPRSAPSPGPSPAPSPGPSSPPGVKTGTVARPTPTARPAATAPVMTTRDDTVRLGDQLVGAGLISRDQLRVAMIEQKRTGAMLGQVLVDLGFLTDQTLAEIMAHNSGRDRFDPLTTVADPSALAPLSEETARRLRVFPVGYSGRLLRLAMADPLDVVAMDEARRPYGRDTRVEPLASSEAEITQAIDRAYGHTLTLDGVLRELESLGEAGADPDIAHDTDAHPVVRLVNALLLDAVKRRASDIHFEPDGAFLRVRLRIDGVLVQTLTFHKQYWAAVAQRLKILADMNIADRHSPQDGRFSMTVAHRKVDFRASVMPTVHGENVVLRVLDRSATPLMLDQLGFAPDALSGLRRLALRPEGLMLVTGPTGSGKTTTLYALMDHISGPDLNIVTLEDPVEYDLPLLRQTQVRDGARLGFADGIRAILRQDPDVILVGEIRDPDTASMALRAAMTGHQVYATIHANDALGALPRLMDLGVSPGLLAGTLSGILAQRLARRLCPHCRREGTAAPDECRLLGVETSRPPTIWRAVGCDSCGHLGYRGRVPLTELVGVTPELDALLAQGAPLSQVRALADRQGLRPLLADGVRLVLSGIIDIPALVRAVDVTRKIG